MYLVGNNAIAKIFKIIWGNKNSLTALLLKQGFQYHKVFSKFYDTHSELIVKYNVGLKALLQLDIPEPVFYGPRHEKICLQGFRQSEIRTSLLSYRD